MRLKKSAYILYIHDKCLYIPVDILVKMYHPCCPTQYPLHFNKAHFNLPTIASNTNNFILIMSDAHTTCPPLITRFAQESRRNQTRCTRLGLFSQLIIAPRWKYSSSRKNPLVFLLSFHHWNASLFQPDLHIDLRQFNNQYRERCASSKALYVDAAQINFRVSWAGMFVCSGALCCVFVSIVARGAMFGFSRNKDGGTRTTREGSLRKTYGILFGSVHK